MGGKLRRVLLIEDSTTSRLLRDHLARSAAGNGFEVVRVAKLGTAIGKLVGDSFDAVLVGGSPCGASVLDVVKRVREVSASPAIVLVCDDDDDKDGARALELGAQDCLSKRELGANVLGRAIRYAIERKQSEETLKRSNQQLREALERIIQAMALTVEARDPYTAGHQRRVAELAVAMGKSLGLPEETNNVLHLAGSVHDIGKVGVPAEILSKPGPLSKVEFGLFRAHPQVGYDILKTIDFPWPIAQIVGQHHERMDGSGYPDGLAGDRILMEARILGVADVVEAMASHRPYRPALGIEDALAEIANNKGKLYDPAVVSACDRVVRSGTVRLDDPA